MTTKPLRQGLRFRTLLILAFFSIAFWDGFKSAYALSDYITVTESTNLGIRGGLLSSAPGSCTGVPNGLAGHCGARAQAAVNAWVNGSFAFGSDWSDLREAAVPPSIKAFQPPEPATNIGTSWIPQYCDRPSCGHLLKGDVLPIDENEDGKIDHTWIDKNGNGVRENGEVDRLRVEQFAWGATSLILDFNNLGSPSDPRMFTESGTSPPGLSRARVRVALGDNPECVDVFSPDCHLSTGGVGVIALPGSIPDDLSNPNDRSSTIDNNDFYGICDPDRFTGDLASIQRQLDNCLWKIGSTPVTAPENSSVTGEGMAIRNSWIDQVTTKYTASSTPNRQEFNQNWSVIYSFQKVDPVTGAPVPVDEALYDNIWFGFQGDSDPNPELNFVVDPNTGDLISGSQVTDTYNSFFGIEHRSLGRRYGFDFFGNPIGPDAGDTPLDPALIGQTNPTNDPFWEADDGPLGFDTDFSTNAKSGVGQEAGFRFLYVQQVEGWLLSCINCTHTFSGVAHEIKYNFTYDDKLLGFSGQHP